MLKHIGKALVASIVLAGISGFGIASAQTQPATSSTTVAQTAPAPAKKPPLVIFHVQAMSTYNVGSSDLALPGQYCTTVGDCGATGQYQFAAPVTHFNYGAQININKHWYLNYLHNYIDQNIGRVGVPAKYCPNLPCTSANETIHSPYTYQKLNDDRVDDASLNYNDGIVLTSIGWHQRVRQCCGNPVNSGLPNQVAWHEIYLGESARLGPNSKYFGRLYGIGFQEQYIPHNTSPIISGHVTEGSKTHIQFYPNITLPVGNPHTSTFAVTGSYTNNFDYFLNSPIMYLYNQVDYGVIKKFPPYVTLTIINSNLYQFHEGYPYTNSDTINRNKLLMTLDVALPAF